LTKIYRIRVTASEPGKSSFLAMIFLGESFSGRLVNVRIPTDVTPVYLKCYTDKKEYGHAQPHVSLHVQSPHELLSD